MSLPPWAARSIAAEPCQSSCAWTRTTEVWCDVEHGDLPVFACSGCGSEWVRTQPWTPIDAAGNIPDEVADERALRHETRAAGITSGLGGDGVGTADS